MFYGTESLIGPSASFLDVLGIFEENLFLMLIRNGEEFAFKVL